MVPVVVILALLLLTATPLEQAPAFQAARDSYEAFEFDEARQAFENLADDAALDDADRANLLVWIGMCHAEEGALRKAARTFEEAAALDPDVAPLPTMSPKARRMLDDARRKAPPRRPVKPSQVSPPPPTDPHTDPPAGPPADPASGSPDSPGSPAEPTGAADMHPAVLGGAAAMGVGIVAAAASFAAGLAAAGAADSAREEPNAAAAAARFAGAQQLAVTANAGFAVAGVAAVAGLVGLLIGLTGD